MELKPHEIRYAGRPRTPRDPRKEKLMDYRRQRGGWRWNVNKENKVARKTWNRLNRKLAKQAIRTARDYDEIDVITLKKTSGWWTW